MQQRATHEREIKRDASSRFDGVIRTPFGAVGVRVESLGSEQECVAAITFLPPGTREVAAKNRIAENACAQIARYLDDPAYAFELPLAPIGTRFQRRVWDKIAAIPLGRVRRYGEVARELRSAPRAVGQACGANFFPLVIPCHRIVAASGIGGFAHADDGFLLTTKRWLLEREGVTL